MPTATKAKTPSFHGCNPTHIALFIPACGRLLHFFWSHSIAATLTITDDGHGIGYIEVYFQKACPANFLHMLEYCPWFQDLTWLEDENAGPVTTLTITIREPLGRYRTYV
jgi:hypothetical protein